MIRPTNLIRGDKVAIVAPAGRFDKTALSEGISIIEQWGLHVFVGKNAECGNNYFSGTDTERLEDIQWAMDDPEIKAIFCARGGYGTTRILDGIDISVALKAPKWLIGFSDITALHLKFHKAGIESIHSVMPAGFSNAASKSIETLRQLLFEGDVKYTFPTDNNSRLGNAKGQIIGGNLSLLNDSIGTENDVDFKGKVLFLEEVDEYLYKIDRMIVQLKRAGKLADLSGLIIGHFTGVKDTSIPFGKTLNAAILDLVKEYDYPVAFGVSIGHEPLNLAIPYSRNCNLEVNSNETIVSFGN